MRRILAALLVAVLLAAGCSADDSSTESASDEAAESGSEGGAGLDRAAVETEAASSEEAAGESGDEAMADDATEESLAEPATAEDAADADSADTADSADGEEDSVVVTEPEQPQAGTLTAGDIDDNLNFEFFNDYIDRTEDVYGQRIPGVELGDRVVINAMGSDGDGLANARLDISTGNESIPVFTNSVGTAYFFPTLTGAGNWDELSVTVTTADGDQGEDFVIGGGDLANDDSVTLTLQNAESKAPAALDLALVIDTTGSMGDELNYLTTEFTSIVDQLSERYANVDMRFALVVYRDDGDDYITQVYDFAGVEEIQARLREQQAEGGGDFPEAMDAALINAIDLDWRTGDVSRVMIVNADAPPHDSGFAVSLDAAQEAREAGIRIYPLAASGVEDTAEYLMRVMAATTGGRHLFLTDDSGVGFAHSEPKVQCYVVSRLDHLLVRILASEVSGERLEPIPEQLIRTVGDYDNGFCSDAG